MVIWDSERLGKQEIGPFRRALPQFCIVAVKNLILFSVGLIIGYPTVLIPGLQHKFGSVTDNDLDLVSDEQVSWVGSINFLLVPLGNIISGYVADPLGKRRMMQLLNIPMISAWGLIYFSTNINYIYAGLALAGLSGGLFEAPAVLYISETVEPKYRGMLSATGTATVIAGVCFEFIIGSMFHWRYVAAISAIIPCMAFTAVLFIPESPYWLYAHDRIEDAQKSLQWLRGWVQFQIVEDEFKAMRQEVDDDRVEQKARKLGQRGLKARFSPFARRGVILPFLLVIFTFFASHFSGMTPSQTYAFQILQTFDVPIDKYHATILLGITEFIGSIIGVVLIRSMGKRRITFFSMIGCGAGFFAVALYTYKFMEPVRQFDRTMSVNQLDYLGQSAIGIVGDSGTFVGGEFLKWLPMALLLSGVFFAHIGLRLLPWILIGEVFPIDCRAAAAGISSALANVMGFAANKSFLSTVATLTLHGTFWLYSAIAFGGCIILYFTLPETENKTLLEIRQTFEQRNNSTNPKDDDS